MYALSLLLNVLRLVVRLKTLTLPAKKNRKNIIYLLRVGHKNHHFQGDKGFVL